MSVWVVDDHEDYLPPAPPTYTLVLRGKRFTLSDSQLRADSPNWLTGHFKSNQRPKTLYEDRKPDVFAVVAEHLAGYEVFPVKGIVGMDEKEAARAVLVEAEFFKLKKLAAKAKEALSKGGSKPTMLWPLRATQKGQFLKFDKLQDFYTFRPGTPSPPDDVLLSKTPVPTVWRFRSLQIRLQPSVCFAPSSGEEGEARFQALFIDPLQFRNIKNLYGKEVFDVEYWDSATQQASVSIDGKKVSLEVFLQWATNPSPQLSKISALRPLSEIFHPELVPKGRLLVTLSVRSAVGYFTSQRMRLLHLDIHSEDQGYGHLLDL
ncbi:hypothetical protein JCM10207_001551 [Rhodosporidiobolus poonsookiae]